MYSAQAKALRCEGTSALEEGTVIMCAELIIKLDSTTSWLLVLFLRCLGLLLWSCVVHDLGPDLGPLA